MAAEPVKIGLVAALSGPSAKSGEGIIRGITIAIDEINARGGVLGGRMLELVRRDDKSNPAKGQTAARELIDKEGVAVIFGGIDSPVSLAIVPVMNTARVPFMGVWAAATNITRNGADPNYIFRVSAVDVLVDRALIKHAMTSFGSKKPGLMLVNNGWGESNLGGLTAAAEAAGIKLAGAEKFDDKDADMTPQLQRLRAAGADAVILVANAAPGAQVVKSLQRSAWMVPVVSHWGISGDASLNSQGPRRGKCISSRPTVSSVSKMLSASALAAMMAKYPDVKGPGDVTPPVGVANAYDAMQLIALAIAKAGSTEGPKLREGLLGIENYQGLIKNYTKPFTDTNHDALNENDYVMVRYNGDQIEPITG